MTRKGIRVTVHVLSLALGLALVVAYIVLADPKAVIETVRGIGPTVLLLAVAAFACVWAIRVWTFHRLGTVIPGRVSWSTANRAFLGSSILNLVYPARMGDVSLVVHLARDAGYGGATALVAQYRAQSVLALGTLALAIVSFLVLAPALQGATAVLVLLAGYAITLTLVGLVVMAILKRSHPRLSSFAGWLARFRRLGPLKQKGKDFVEHLAGTTRPSVFLPALVLAGIAWFLEIMIAVAFILTLAPGTHLVLAMGAPLVGIIAAMARLTPGGLGIFEGTMIAVLLGQGVTAAAAVGAATMTRVFMTFMILLVGFVAAYKLVRDTTDAGLEIARTRIVAPSRQEPEEDP